MKFAIIVPARIGSTRFPQKLLHEIRGKPVLVWTADRIRTEAAEFPLYFAVDNQKLVDALQNAGYDAIMTDPAHTCGTDRIAEVNRHLQAEYVINVQADEPLVTGDHVKLVCDAHNHAIYFSRAPIPYFRDSQGTFETELAADAPILIHLGLYAYTASFLQTFSTLPPGKLELLEKLELLRALERGYRIAVGVTKDSLIEIDTPEHAVQFEQVVKERFPLA